MDRIKIAEVEDNGVRYTLTVPKVAPANVAQVAYLEIPATVLVTAADQPSPIADDE
jgi:hypothetical protein